jgi:hypothetical protein
MSAQAAAEVVIMASRHRTYWVIRRRYRRAGYLGSLISVAAAAFYLMPIVHGAEGAAAAAAGGSSTVETMRLGLLGLAALMPPLVARLIWRFHRRRYLDDIYPLGVV